MGVKDHFLNPNIDRYLNPVVPPNILPYILPKHVSHWLGYRSEAAKEPPILVQWMLMILATVAGLCLVGGVFNFAPGIQQWHPPTIVASLGASAVLDYNTIKSPLAQPRNAIVGHTLAAIVGTAIAKAFMLSPSFFANYDWVVAAIACATASLVMSMTNTIHPPGGATAILACTQKQNIALGWRYPPLMLLASVLMLSVACLFNNTFRQYPTHWWSPAKPEELGLKLPGRRKKKEDSDEENMVENGAGLKKVDSSDGSDSERTVARQPSREIEVVDGLQNVQIDSNSIKMPPQMQLSGEELVTLRRLMTRLSEKI